MRVMKERISGSIRRSLRRRLRLARGQSESVRRPLNAEQLESRCLLASDFQNPINRFDVNVDSKVTPTDLITLFSDIRSYGSRYLTASRSGIGGGEGEPSSGTSRAVMLDVDGDSRLTMQDAVHVLKKLGEGAPGDPQARFRATITNTSGQAINSVSVGQTVLVNLTVQDIRDPNDPRFPDLQGSQARMGLTQAFLDLVYSLNASVVPNFYTTPAPAHTFNHFAPYTLFASGSNNGVPYPNLGVGIIEDLGGNQNFTIDNSGNVIFDPLGPGEFNLVQLALHVDSGNPKAVNDNYNVDESSQNNFLTVLSNDTVNGNLRVQGSFANGDSNPVATYFSAPDIRSLIVPEAEILYPTVQLPINGVSLGGLTIISASSGNAVVDNNGTPGVGNDDRIRFTPAAGFVGQVEIVYTINDGQSTTATATATVSVGPVNDPPVNVTPLLQTTPEDTALVFSTANANGMSTSDVDAGAATVRVDLAAQHGGLFVSTTAGLTTVNGQNTSALRLEGPIASINAALNGLRYTPHLNYNGADQLVMTTDDLGNTGDGGPKTDVDTVAITVTAVNDAPVNTMPGDQFIVEDEVLTNNDGAGNAVFFPTDVDVGAGNIQVQIAVATGDGPDPGKLKIGSTAGITLVAGADNSPSATFQGTLAAIQSALLNATYTPAAGFIGTVTMTMVTNDLGNTGVGGALTDTDAFAIVVEPAVRPRARADQGTVVEDSAGNIFAVLNNDIPNVEARVTLIGFTQSPNGTVARDDRGTPGDLTDDRLFYTPNPDFFGIDTFGYTINDTSGAGADSTATVTARVTEINDAPTAANDLAATDEDIPIEIVSLNLTGNDSKGPANESGQSLTIVGVSATSAAGASVSLVNGNVRYQSPLNYNGVDTFTYTIQDNGTTNGQPDPKTAVGTVTMTVRSVNDAPVPGAHSGSTDEDTPLAIPLGTLTGKGAPGGGADELGQALSITGVGATSAQGGAVVLAGGMVTYTPAQDFFGTDTFTYTLRDNGQSNGVDDFKSTTGTVTVTVNPLNDAPVVVDDAGIGIKNFTTEHSASTVLANDSPGPANESAQTLSIASVTGLSQQGGTVVLVGQTIQYTPPTGYLGPDVVTYIVRDSGPADGVKQFNETVAHLNLNVIDFIPSPISGFVYMDVDNNGLKGPMERGIGGVRVDLVNTATSAVVDTRRTDPTGHYQFTLTMPGTYTIVEHGPQMILDGLDRVGTQGGTLADDAITFTVNLPGGVTGTGNNFGERGLDAAYFSIYEILASRGSSGDGSSGNGLMIGANGAGDDFWFVTLGGWTNLSDAHARLLGPGPSSIDAIIHDHVGPRPRNLPVDGNRLRIMGHDPSGARVIRFDGAATDFGFTLAASDGEGEGPNDAGQSAESYERDVDALMADAAWA